MALKITCVVLLALAMIVQGHPYGGYGNQGYVGGYQPGVYGDQSGFSSGQGLPNGYGNQGSAGYGGQGSPYPGQGNFPAVGPAIPGGGGSFPGQGGHGGYKDRGY